MKESNIERMNMAGFTFIQHALLYEVDRSIVIAERYDTYLCNEHYFTPYGLKLYHRTCSLLLRLYFDTVLEYPFIVIFELEGSTGTITINQTIIVPDSRHELLDYCQRFFPDALEDVMGTEFQYPDRFPSDDDILRSRYGTNNYPTTDVKRKSWREKAREKELVTA